MKKILLLIVSIAIISLMTNLTTLSKQNALNKKLIGKISWNEWKENCNWDLNPTYYFYFPDSLKINHLKQLINNLKIDSLKFVIFATTTCDECIENLPKLMKILETLKIPENSIELFGLDDKLEEPTINFEIYNVNITPMLFIKYKNKLVSDISYPNLWLDSLIEVFESLE